MLYVDGEVWIDLIWIIEYLYVKNKFFYKFMLDKVYFTWQENSVPFIQQKRNLGPCMPSG